MAKTCVGIEMDGQSPPLGTIAFGYRSGHVYDYFRGKGFEVKIFNGSLAAATPVISAVELSDVVYITGVGHGTADSFKAMPGPFLFTVGKYPPDVPKGKIIHLLSCSTAVGLGPDFVCHGCVAFFGYDIALHFGDNAFIQEFSELDGQIDVGFADGSDADQVYQSVKSSFESRIQAFRSRKARSSMALNLRRAATLQVNLDNLRCPSLGSQWGKTTAKL